MRFLRGSGRHFLHRRLDTRPASRTAPRRRFGGGYWSLGRGPRGIPRRTWLITGLNSTMPTVAVNIGASPYVASEMPRRLLGHVGGGCTQLCVTIMTVVVARRSAIPIPSLVLLLLHVVLIVTTHPKSTESCAETRRGCRCSLIVGHMRGGIFGVLGERHGDVETANVGQSISAPMVVCGARAPLYRRQHLQRSRRGLGWGAGRWWWFTQRGPLGGAVTPRLGWWRRRLLVLLVQEAWRGC